MRTAKLLRPVLAGLGCLLCSAIGVVAELYCIERGVDFNNGAAAFLAWVLLAVVSAGGCALLAVGCLVFSTTLGRQHTMALSNTLTVQDEVDAFTRQLLRERLKKLTTPQVAFFWRIHSYAPYKAGIGEVEKIPKNKLVDCIDLCDRTIRKNEASGKCPECEGSGESGHAHTDGTQYSTGTPPCAVCGGTGRASQSSAGNKL